MGKNIPSSLQLMEPSRKLTTSSVTKQTYTVAKNIRNLLCLITSPWTKVRIQQQCYPQKAYNLMETEQSTIDPHLDQRRNKERK